jgi:hypothetical protein
VAVTTISATGTIDPEVAWERYADLDRWATWAPQIRGVDAPSRRLAPGLRGVVRGLGGLVRVPFEVLDVDEQARTWSWRVSVGPVRLRLEHGVEARAGRPGTRTWLRTHGPAPVVWAYTPVAFVALQALVLTSTVGTGAGR